MSEYFMDTINFEISSACNEKCLHCYRLHKNKVADFLTCDDVAAVLEQIQPISTKDQLVLLTGGEFFLNKEWRQIVQTVIAHKRRFAIYTNGTLMTDDDADFIQSVAEKGLREVQFSLYGMDEAVHDKITGLKGSCKKTKEAILKLKERKVPVFVSCCAMQENKNDFYNVMRWCDKNDIGSAAHLMIFGPSDYSDSNNAQRLSKEDLEAFFKISMENNGELSYVWGEAKPKDSVSDEFYYHESRQLCVSADGSIYPEVGWYEKLGNIHTDDIADIFINSPFMKRLREYKVSEMQCARCTAFEYCTRYPLPHVNANNGQAGKYDKRSCDYMHLIKEFAERRDKIFGKEK